MPAFVDLLNLIERFVERLGRPPVLSAALVVMGCTSLLAVMTVSTAYDAIAAVACVAAGASGLAFGLALGTRGVGDGRAQRRALIEAGWMREAVLPYFVEEIGVAGQRRLRVARRPWRVAAVGAGAAMVVVVVAILGFAELSSGGVAGQATLMPGERVEAFVADHPAPQTFRDLGIVAVLGHTERGDDGLWNVDLTVTRVRDATERTVTLRPGESRLVGGQQLALREVRPLPGVGAARVRISPRAGGAVTDATLEARQPLTLASGGSITLLDGRMAYLGQLGPAAQIEERNPAGEVVRTEWIFTEAPGFDGRHGSGAVAVDLLSVEPPVAVVISVSRAPFSAWSPLFSALGLCGALALAFAAAARGVRVDGRSGDFRVSTLGWAPADPASTADEMLTDEQRRELAALRVRLRLADAESAGRRA